MALLLKMAVINIRTTIFQPNSFGRLRPDHVYDLVLKQTLKVNVINVECINVYSPFPSIDRGEHESAYKSIECPSNPGKGFRAPILVELSSGDLPLSTTPYTP